VRCFIVALLFLLACSPNVEQQAHPAPPAEPAPSADLASQDRDFLERAAEGGNAEIAIGMLALMDGYTQRAEVAAFGRLMAADHRAINQQLAAIATAKRISLPTSLGEHQQNFDRLVDLKRDEFDREFVRVMIEDHQEAVRLYREEAEGGVDPQLKAFAAATLPKIEAHLAHAEKLPRG
jgi:putative membrane protein